MGSSAEKLGAIASVILFDTGNMRKVVAGEGGPPRGKKRARKVNLYVGANASTQQFKTH